MIGFSILLAVYGALVWYFARTGSIRTALGFILAPLAPAVVSAVLSRDIVALLVFAPFSYFFSLLGVPAYFILREFGWLNFWTVLVTSALLGSVAAILLNAVSFHGGGLEITNARNLLVTTGFGALVGSIFWLIALSPMPRNRHSA